MLKLSCLLHFSILPRVKEEDVVGQRHSQGQPPPVPDEVGNQGQEQLSKRVEVTCDRPHHGPHARRDPLDDCKPQTKLGMMRLQETTIADSFLCCRNINYLTEREAVEGLAGQSHARAEAEQAVDGKGGGESGARSRDGH